MQRLEDVVEDHGVPSLVPNERSVEILDALLRAGAGRPEGCLSNDETMLERARACLRLRVDLEAHRAELHLGDGVVTIAALRCRRQSDDVASLHLAQDSLELHRRNMVTLVDDDQPVPRHDVSHRVAVHQALSVGFGRPTIGDRVTTLSGRVAELENKARRRLTAVV